MPCPGSGPPGFLALLAPGLALLAHLFLPSQAGVRRLPAGTSPQGAPGRTLILLDVSTRSPLRVTSQNFLSLQLDPSILHDGWLDFLRSSLQDPEWEPGRLQPDSTQPSGPLLELKGELPAWRAALRGAREPRWRRTEPGLPGRGRLPLWLTAPHPVLCSSRRLVTLARGLAPAFLRFAGKRTDFLQFQNVKNLAKSRGGPGPDYYLKNYEDGESPALGTERECEGGGGLGGKSPWGIGYRSSSGDVAQKGHNQHPGKVWYLAALSERKNKGVRVDPTWGQIITSLVILRSQVSLLKFNHSRESFYTLAKVFLIWPISPLGMRSILQTQDIIRSDIALDKQKGCKIAQHPDIMLELQREKAAQMHLVLLKEQFSNTYSNLTLTVSPGTGYLLDLIAPARFDLWL
ncbi:hypothetical protein lerEdw1_008030 [Lerista edwardsae]|nr:hypothetical protein lerEdw1_008030 [Lerista edwardsae]